MSELDVIRQIAQQVLNVPTLTGTQDRWLWDRTLRILRNVEHICRMPELTEQAAAIDRFCLIAATYFADSGFAHFTDAEDVSARLVLGGHWTSQIASSLLLAFSIALGLRAALRVWVRPLS